MARRRSPQNQKRKRDRPREYLVLAVTAGAIYAVWWILGVRGWHGIAAFSIAAVLGLAAAIVALAVLDPRIRRPLMWLVPTLICYASRASEARDFGAASRITGAGSVTRAGRIVIWTDVPGEIAAKLEHVLSVTESAFQIHLGLTDRRQRGLRVLVFQRETDFLSYVRGFFHSAGSLAGCYLGLFQPRIVICRETSESGRLGLLSVATHEMTHHLQRQCLGGMRPPWLEEGIAVLIQERAQPALHPPGAVLRYLRAEATRGTLLGGSDLLEITYLDLHAHVEKSQDETKEFLTTLRIYSQSAVLCRFLRDADRDRFRDFLLAGRKIRTARRCARAFEQLLQTGPDEAMQTALAKLREQPLPPFSAPPDDVRAHIEGDLVSRARGGATSPRLRIRAIRTLGLLGYPWRADVLIQLLSDPDEIIRAEAAIALANLSGESRGADAGLWREWLDSLDSDVVAPAPGA